MKEEINVLELIKTIGLAGLRIGRGMFLGSCGIAIGRHVINGFKKDREKRKENTEEKWWECFD